MCETIYPVFLDWHLPIETVSTRSYFPAILGYSLNFRPHKITSPVCWASSNIRSRGLETDTFDPPVKLFAIILPKLVPWWISTRFHFFCYQLHMRSGSDDGFNKLVCSLLISLLQNYFISNGTINQYLWNV